MNWWLYFHQLAGNLFENLFFSPQRPSKSIPNLHKYFLFIFFHFKVIFHMESYYSSFGSLHQSSSPISSQSHFSYFQKNPRIVSMIFLFFFFFTETICFFHTYYVCFIGPPININSHVHQEVDTYWSVFLRLTFMIFYLDLIHTMTL